MRSFRQRDAVRQRDVEVVGAGEQHIPAVCHEQPAQPHGPVQGVFLFEFRVKHAPGATVLSPVPRIEHDRPCAVEVIAGRIEQGLKILLCVQPVDARHAMDELRSVAQPALQAVAVSNPAIQLQRDEAVSGVELVYRRHIGRHLRWFGQTIEPTPPFQWNPAIDPITRPSGLGNKDRRRGGRRNAHNAR